MNPSTIGSNDVERVAESHCDRTTLKNAIIAMLKRLSEFGKEVYVIGLPLQFWWHVTTPMMNEIKRMLKMNILLKN